MTEFDRQMYGFRFAETMRGDSLQTIAARELGDASRWTELIAFNSLVPPFITDDAALVMSGVILSGGIILVPAPAPVATTTTDPEKVFESDIRLGSDGALMTDAGDFAVVTGVQNLARALKNRIEVERGDLIYHTEYGSNVRRIVGSVNSPTAALLAGQYAKSAVQADPRIDRVTKVSADVVGDRVSVTIEAVTVSGRPVTVTASP